MMEEREVEGRKWRREEGERKKRREVSVNNFKRFQLEEKISKMA